MRLLLPALLALAAGCAGADHAAMGTEDTGAPLGAPGDEEGLSLRIDIEPPASSGFLPQSFSIPDAGSWEGLRIELSPTVRWTGQVLGFRANPVADPEPPDTGGADTGAALLRDVVVPGEQRVPVAAAIEVWREPGIARARAETDEDGRFVLEVPAASGYAVSVVASDPADLPLYLEDGRKIRENTSEDVVIDYGTAVYGTLLAADAGGRLSSARVFLVDPETGMSGPVVEPDEDGGFLLRALPGTWLLVVDSDDASLVPRVETEIEVGDEPVRADVDLGSLAGMDVSGRVVDASGRPVYEATVRFESTSLASAPGTARVETETGADGRFSTDLLVGTWNVEVVPPYDSDGDLAPTGFSLEVTGSTDLGDLPVGERFEWSGRAWLPDGSPGAGVVVTATELGYDGASYSATADEDGRFELRVPDVPLHVALKPPSAGAAITHLELDHPSEDAPDEIVLEYGLPVSGTVLADGEPLPYALVELRDDEDRLYATTFADAEGAFSLRILDAWAH